MIGQSLYPWQAQAWRKLTQTLEANRLPHALLITGHEGVGKQSFALALIARLFCKTATGEQLACGECSNCKLIAAESHPDFVSITVEEGKTQIAVQQVRDVIAHLGMKSYRGEEKVALLSPAEAMNVSSANSLLKTLEEPTEGTVLVLVTAKPSRLPATILSRCQRLEIKPPETAEALQWLNSEHGKADWAPVLAFAAGAPLRAAELHQAGFSERIAGLEQQVADIVAGRSDPTAVAADWAGNEPELCMAWLKMWTGHLIRGRTLGTLTLNLSGADARKIENFIQNIDLKMIFNYLDDVNRASRLLETPINKQGLMEAVLVPWGHGLKRAVPIAD